MERDLKDWAADLVALIEKEGLTPWEDADGQIEVNVVLFSQEMETQARDVYSESKQNFGQLAYSGYIEAKSALQVLPDLQAAVERRDKSQALTALQHIRRRLETLAR